MKSIPFAVMTALVLASAASAQVQVVDVTGQADLAMLSPRQAAIDDALRLAVEQAGGVIVLSESESRNFALVRDVINTECAGFVEKYEVLAENPNQDGAYTVRIRATVRTAGLGDRLRELLKRRAAWKTLLQSKGYPRLMVVGSVDRQPFESRLTAEIQGTLERARFTVIDLDMLTENQRREAELAARGELDPGKAARIVRSRGCDYFVLVQVSGSKYPPKTIYDVTQYPVDATGILKVVRVDSSQLIASEVTKIQHLGSTPERAYQDATTKATQAALAQAIRRIAVNWLEEVSPGGGQQVTVVLNRVSFDVFSNATSRLEQWGSVQQVIADQFEAEGQTHLRLVTSVSAAEVGRYLQNAIPALRTTNATKYRIEMVAGAADGGSVDSRRMLLIAAIAVGVVIVVIALMALRRR